LNRTYWWNISIWKSTSFPIYLPFHFSIEHNVNEARSSGVGPSYTGCRCPIGYFILSFVRCFDRLSCVILFLAFCVNSHRWLTSVQCVKQIFHGLLVHFNCHLFFLSVVLVDRLLIGGPSVISVVDRLSIGDDRL
jgi:hypothetical protein